MAKFKKFRKVYRVFFPLAITEKMKFENKLKTNPKIVEVENIKDYYRVKTTRDLILNIRSSEHSDYEVFEQIFNFEEFEIIRKLLALNFENKEDIIIIDSGANVGYTTLYFKSYFIDSQIFSVEPSNKNADYFKSNVFDLNIIKNVRFYEKALSQKSGMKYSISRDFRDRKDWAITTESCEEGDIDGITINEIIDENNIDTVTFLKIDIEGAERYIFENENDVSFLKKTKIIALEIHDEFNIRTSICNCLKKNNFYLFGSGELTIGLNKDYL